MSLSRDHVLDAAQSARAESDPLRQDARLAVHVLPRRRGRDVHLSNFGSYAGPDRRLVFGVNDFDETLPGPFQWDVKRLVASFAVAGRDRGFGVKQRESVNMAVARSYREAIRSFAELRALELTALILTGGADEAQTLAEHAPEASALWAMLLGRVLLGRGAINRACVLLQEGAALFAELDPVG